MRGDYWPKWRIDILLELADGSRSAREIGDMMGISKGTVLGKLSRLKRKGVTYQVLSPQGKAGTPWVDGELVALARLEAAAAKDDENLMPYLVDCCHAYATIGEMVARLKACWGEFQEPIRL